MSSNNKKEEELWARRKMREAERIEHKAGMIMQDIDSHIDNKIKKK